MNIEDVKQLSDRELNIKLSVLTGYTDTINKKLIERGLKPEEYENDIFLNYVEFAERAREAQAKAIKANANKYVATLYDVMYFDEGVPPDPTDNYLEVTYRAHGVAYMLQATPRQIAMATYITLQEVQSNGR